MEAMKILVQMMFGSKQWILGRTKPTFLYPKTSGTGQLGSGRIWPWNDSFCQGKESMNVVRLREQCGNAFSLDG